MAYINQTVEEILCSRWAWCIEENPKERRAHRSSWPGHTRSLDDDDLCETLLVYVRDFKQERRGIRDIDVAVKLRKADDEALAMADLMSAMMGANRLN